MCAGRTSRKERSAMWQKILLAVDGSESSTKAVEYVGEFISKCEESDVTLYHVITIPPELLEHGGSEDPQEESRLGKVLREEKQKWEEKKRGQAEREIFAPAKKILKGKGVREEVTAIRCKLTSEAHPDVALAIINEVNSGGYGTLVMGKRGISMLKEFVFGSVTCKVVHHIDGCAIWIIE
jgi:nucleotide-binding universal stress UspA family protein